MGAEYRIIVIDGNDHHEYCEHFYDAVIRDHKGHYRIYLGDTSLTSNSSIRILKSDILEHLHTDNIDQFFCKGYDGIKLIRVTWDK